MASTEAIANARANLRNGGKDETFFFNKFSGGGATEVRFTNHEPDSWVPLAVSVCSVTTKKFPGAVVVKQDGVDIYGLTVGDVYSGEKVVKITDARVCLEKLKVPMSTVVDAAIRAAGKLPEREPVPEPQAPLDAIASAELDVSDEFKEAVRLAVDGDVPFSLNVVQRMGEHTVCGIDLRTRTSRSKIHTAEYVVLVVGDALFVAHLRKVHKQAICRQKHCGVPNPRVACRDFKFHEGVVFKGELPYVLTKRQIGDVTLTKVARDGLTIDYGVALSNSKRQRTALASDVANLMDAVLGAELIKDSAKWPHLKFDRGSQWAFH